MTEKFKKVIEDIKNELDSIKYDGDLSDIGNHVGLAIGKYIKIDTEEELGYELIDFIYGVKHGVSLVDGTHP